MNPHLVTANFAIVDKEEHHIARFVGAATLEALIIRGHIFLCVVHGVLIAQSQLSPRHFVLVHGVSHPWTLRRQRLKQISREGGRRQRKKGLIIITADGTHEPRPHKEPRPQSKWGPGYLEGVTRHHGGGDIFFKLSVDLS